MKSEELKKILPTAEENLQEHLFSQEDNLETLEREDLSSALSDSDDAYEDEVFSEEHVEQIILEEDFEEDSFDDEADFESVELYSVPSGSRASSEENLLFYESSHDSTYSSVEDKIRMRVALEEKMSSFFDKGGQVEEFDIKQRNDKRNTRLLYGRQSVI